MLQWVEEYVAVISKARRVLVARFLFCGLRENRALLRENRALLRENVPEPCARRSLPLLRVAGK